MESRMENPPGTTLGRSASGGFSPGTGEGPGRDPRKAEPRPPARFLLCMGFFSRFWIRPPFRAMRSRSWLLKFHNDLAEVCAGPKAGIGFSYLVEAVDPVDDRMDRVFGQEAIHCGEMFAG